MFICPFVSSLIWTNKILSYLVYHWKCMPEWKAVNMSFLMTKVGLNVFFFSINQSVSHHNTMVLLLYVSQLSNVTSQLKGIYGLHVGVQRVMMTVVSVSGHVVLTSPERLLILYKSGIFAIDTSIVNFQTWPRQRWFGIVLETTEEDLPGVMRNVQEAYMYMHQHVQIFGWNP